MRSQAKINQKEQVYDDTANGEIVAEKLRKLECKIFRVEASFEALKKKLNKGNIDVSAI